jgi:hypothetical protein
MPRHRKLANWSESGRGAAEEFAYTPPMAEELKEQIRRDEEKLAAALRVSDDAAKLIECLKRLKSNAKFLGSTEGFGTGYAIAKEHFSAKVPGCDSMIIDIIKQHPEAGPTEICELIDDYNYRAKDRNELTIDLPYDDLKAGHEHAWTHSATVPKVKQRISELKSKAWRSLYASEFQQLHFVDPVEAAQREVAKKKAARKKAIKREDAKVERKARKS